MGPPLDKAWAEMGIWGCQDSSTRIKTATMAFLDEVSMEPRLQVKAAFQDNSTDLQHPGKGEAGQASDHRSRAMMVRVEHTVKLYKGIPMGRMMAMVDQLMSPVATDVHNPEGHSLMVPDDPNPTASSLMIPPDL